MEDWVKICKALALSGWANQGRDLHMLILFLFLILHTVDLNSLVKHLKYPLSNSISADSSKSFM